MTEGRKCRKVLQFGKIVLFNICYIYVFSQYFSDIIFKPKNSKKLKKNMTSNHEIYNNKKSLVNCFAVRAEKFFFLKLQMKVL